MQGIGIFQQKTLKLAGIKQITVSKLNLLKPKGTGIAKLEKDNSGNKAGRPSGNTPPPYQSQLPPHIFCPVRRGV
ncbi:hypothetical protein METHB2_240002 [Candidatus Methylobacter favarea]|uniref:Uncharacterized protein n=1 Tax=Candidatus Methylobacter favarea TaxID=2707345 RepID=A0A8S0WA68_9GAMM|nr:hypothetical protein METHB2_240002 [Candidatus Methylobacter favarea]